MENSKMTLKNATYPLPKGVSSKLKWTVAIAPLFFSLASGWVLYNKNPLNAYIFNEAGAMSHFALITMIAALAGTLCNPIIGKFGDLFGRKRVALILTAIYCGSVAVIGLGKGALMMGIGFGVMGAIQSALMGLTNGLVMDAFDPETRTSLLSFVNAMDATAGMVGPIVAGKLADKLGAQNTMLIAIIPLALAWITVLAIYPDIRNIKENVKIDFKGVGALWIGIGPICFALAVGGKQIPWNSPIIPALFVIGVIGCFLFYKVEAKQTQPIVNFKLFKVSGLRYVVLFGLCGGMVGPLNVYFNLFGKNVMGLTATETGYISFLVVLSIICNPFVGKYLAKTKNFKLLLTLAALLNILQCVLYGFFLNADSSWVTAMIFKVTQTMSQCFSMAPIYAYFSFAVPADKRGMVTGVFIFGSSLCNSVLSAIFALIMNSKGGDIASVWTLLCCLMGVMGIIRTFAALKLPTTDKLNEQVQAADF